MKVKVARGKPAVPKRRKRGWIRRLTGWAFLIAVGFYAVITLQLVFLCWVNPLFTTVQIQHRIEALFDGRSMSQKQISVPLSRISLQLQHAVIAAEDTRFYQHHGIDFEELHKVVQEDIREGEMGRGASTITQQLVKNLFLTTHRSLIRKGLEFTLAPVAEIILPKERILELYLNEVEWGPGVWGAEAAAQFHYGVSASRLSREQAARLAAILPAPTRRKPSRMDAYSAEILTRMRQMGW